MIKKNKLIIIAHNDQLHLTFSGRKGPGKVIGVIPFSMTSSSDDFSYTIPAQAKKVAKKLLILPNYFIGNTTYPFASGKRSIAEAFIRRKLAESFPATPEMTDFFNYTYLKAGQDPGSLYTYYLQDPVALRPYRWLTDAGIRPDRITTPALIWQHKIGKLIEGASGGSLCLIHTLPAESHLYFFVQGNFLFSRSIKFPESVVSDSGKLDSLAYEISQSLHLFSQKVKSEINRFYLVSSINIDDKGLSGRIGKDVQRIDTDQEEDRQSEDDPMSGPLAAFSWSDLDAEKIPAISHRKVAAEKAWYPVQRTGIITGMFLFLLLCGETFYLNLWSRSNLLSESSSVTKGMTINRQIIEKYNEHLDMVINERQHPDPAGILAGVMLSLPENVTIQELEFNIESPFQVIIKGNVKTDSPEILKSALSSMVEGLTHNLKPVRPPSMSDISLDMEKSALVSGSTGYSFHIQVDLK